MAHEKSMMQLSIDISLIFSIFMEIPRPFHGYLCPVVISESQVSVKQKIA